MDTAIMVKRLGTRIESLRCNADITTEALAQKANLHQAHIEQLEDGQLTNVSVAQIAAIADALGVSLSDLFSDLESVHSENLDPEFSFTLFRRKLGYICYPPVVDWYPVTSLMQYMLYLPLFHSDDLIDMLLRIDGCFAGHEQYVLELIRRRISFIRDSPAKRYADRCLAHLDQDHFLAGDLGNDDVLSLEHEAYHEKILQFAARMCVNATML